VPSSKPRLFNQFKNPLADRAADVLVMLTRLGGPNAYCDTVNALWERQPVSNEFDIKLCVSDEVDPNPSERPLVERIFAAFRLAKLEQAKQDSIFLPSGGWKNVLHYAYAYLTEGYEHNDIDRFHYFLANFGAWEEPTGIGESSVFSRLKKSNRKRKYFEQYKMSHLIQWWQTFESNGRSLSELTMPCHGNQGGVLVDGHMILPESVFSEINSRLLAGFVEQEQPLIAELGGGFPVAADSDIDLCRTGSAGVPVLGFVLLDDEFS
jgi:hypothetical protein